MKCDGISKGHKHEISGPFLEFDFVFTNTVKCTLPIFIYYLIYFILFFSLARMLLNGKVTVGTFTLLQKCIFRIK